VSKQVLTISGWSNKERSLTGQFVGFGELSLIKSGGKSLGCRKWCVALWWLHVIVQSSLIEDWSQSWRHLTGCRLNAFVVPAYRFWAVWTKFTQQPRLLIGRSLRRSASWISQLTLGPQNTVDFKNDSSKLDGGVDGVSLWVQVERAVSNSLTLIS
jgi:hypothetical protein